MIELKNICKSYGGREVLRDFSAVFPEGVTIVMGPSGRGKTTLLRLMMGLEVPDAGEIAGVPRRIAAVFQEDRLPLCFRVPVCAGMTAAPGTSRETVLEHLRALGLGQELLKPVRELSGGQRRRVAVARAVLAAPDVLFLDEAFTGLDDAIRSTTAEYILRNMTGKTIIAVTHDLDEAELLGGSILNL